MKIVKPKNKSLSLQVAEELEKQISLGSWKVGSKIPSETELMELFGVSRNTLREAIRYLAIIGVLDTRPGNGTYIITENVFNASMKRRLENEKLSHILETRMLLEPEIINLATMRGTDEDINNLVICHNNLLNSFENYWTDYVEADIKFHSQIADMCKNPLLADFYRAITEALPEYIHDNFLKLCNDNKDLYLHKELVDLIKIRDGEKAKDITSLMLSMEMKLIEKTLN
ncbi:MAG: FadR/GntR family transcriptional regulator [Tissierellia bacterium]|nr:FadR/GntR family transcriptional regulator [Tissierellia bacterium]